MGDEQTGDSPRRPTAPDLLIALNRPCRERRIHHASRVVWSSCRDFGVISRNLGHGPTAYAAARHREATSFTKIPRKFLFTLLCRWWPANSGIDLDPTASVADQIFADHQPRHGECGR